jgi:hypothetical protein
MLIFWDSCNRSQLNVPVSGTLHPYVAVDHPDPRVCMSDKQGLVLFSGIIMCVKW